MIESEYIENELLDEYHSFMQLYVLSTFTSYSRSFNFNRLPYKERCLNCSKSFLYIKDKRKKRYCSHKCRDTFYYKFPTWVNLRWDIAYRDQLICQICKKKVIYIEEVKSYVKLGVTYLQEKEIFDVDHIQEISTFNEGIEQAKAFFDRENLQLVCKPCHKIKTANFLSKRFSKGKSVAIIVQRTKSKKLMQYL